MDVLNGLCTFEFLNVLKRARLSNYEMILKIENHVEVDELQESNYLSNLIEIEDGKRNPLVEADELE